MTGLGQQLSSAWFRSQALRGSPPRPLRTLVAPAALVGAEGATIWNNFFWPASVVPYPPLFIGAIVSQVAQ